MSEQRNCRECDRTDNLTHHVPQASMSPSYDLCPEHEAALKARNQKRQRPSKGFGDKPFPLRRQ